MSILYANRALASLARRVSPPNNNRHPLIKDIRSMYQRAQLGLAQSGLDFVISINCWFCQ